MISMVLVSIGFYLLIGLICLPNIASAFNVINNNIIGDPVVQCGPEKIDVQAITNLPFEGVVYIKDWRKSNGCFSNNSFNFTNNSTPHLSVPLHDLSQCGMEMKRNVHNGDVVIKGVWVFSFHPMFVTQVDRAFSVNCIFKQREYTVTSKFIVNELNTKVIGRTATMPSVGMKIISGRVPDPQLPDVTTVKVGDQIQILWYLPTQSNVVGIRIKRCTAESRKGNRVQIISDGCTMDPLAISDVIYSAEKDTAHAFSTAFKFADNEDMWFKCTVAVCMKMTNATKHSHESQESCDENQVCGKRKRRAKRQTDTDILDVKQSDDEILEKHLNVLDLYNKNHIRRANDSRISFYAPGIQKQLSARQKPSSSVCMSRNVFTVLSIVVLLTYIACVSIIFVALHVYWSQKM